MSRWSDNVQMYWAHAIGTLLFGIVVLRYLALGQWEAYLKPFAIAAFGYLCIVASHEVADWTGRYGWTYDSFWTYPPSYIKLSGFGMLLGVLLFGI